jgi:hypothetical protein
VEKEKGIPMGTPSANTFSHPDFTVGAGISSARRKNAFVGYTTGMEFHQSPKYLYCHYQKVVAILTYNYAFLKRLTR